MPVSGTQGMDTLRAEIQALTLKACHTAFPGQSFLAEDIEIAQTKDPKLGHYQCNSAMRFTKLLGQSPREIAEALKVHLVKDSLFEELVIAGPGFINFRIAPASLHARVHTMLTQPNLGLKWSVREKIVIDFSSPNVAKEMHVGHLRSTIIGDCLARVFEFMGHDVLRLNHIGDWGTAFGMLIAYMEEVAPEVLSGQRPAHLSDLMGWYRESKKRFDEDEGFKKTAQYKVVALQQGQPEALHAWKIICAISALAYQEIYDLLDVKLTTRGESFYNPYLAPVLEDLSRKGLIEESQGAKCIFIPGFRGKEGEPLPLIMQKSDGGFNYASTDMASIWHRTQIEHAARLIYVVDAGQSTHFEMIFAAGRKAGYLTDKVRVQHVAFGLVQGADGKKFKTRSGDTEKLIDLLNKAIDKAAEILSARGTPPRDLPHMARVLGINAVKYADLSSNRAQDYQFSYERMLRFEGNTAAFIMYSLVRVISIQRKLVDTVLAVESLDITHPTEIGLALHLVQFSETIEYVANELYPHRLTDYLYGLAERFNAFFRDCRVEGDPKAASRLVLLELTARVFKTGMHMLGLHILERM